MWFRERQMRVAVEREPACHNKKYGGVERSGNWMRLCRPLGTVYKHSYLTHAPIPRIKPVAG